MPVSNTGGKIAEYWERRIELGGGGRAKME